MSNFFQELQRRNVIKSAISYVVIGWAILQVADILFPAFKIPDSAIRYVLYALIGGFPIWVIFAYIYEWTPAGFQRTSTVQNEASVHQQTGKRLNFFIFGGMALAIILLLADRVFNFTDTLETTDEKKAIAVLPFENMSTAEDAYFAKGITEDILTQISQIGDLRVLSNFTIRDYDTEGKTVEEIGEELNVNYLLTGSIRKAGEQLRITCQLVQLDPEEQAWAENYDKRMDDVFAIQTQVAEEVARNLKATLSPAEKAKIKDKPTDNLAAYNIYLKAREKYNTYENENFKEAADLFKKAIALDPEFSLAYAGLAETYGIGYLRGFYTNFFADSAKKYAEKATVLGPKRAETWTALGTAFRCEGNYAEAKEKYQKALTFNPNYLLALANLADISIRQNRQVEAIRLYQKIIKSNPLNYKIFAGMGLTYLLLDMPSKSAAYLQKAISLKQDNLDVKFYYALWHLFYSTPDQAKTQIRKFKAADPQNIRVTATCAVLALNVDQTLAKKYVNELIQSPAFNPSEYIDQTHVLSYLLMEEGKIDSANYWLDTTITILEKKMKEGGKNSALPGLLMEAYAIKGEKEKALHLLDSLNPENDPSPPIEYLKSPYYEDLKDNDRFQKIMGEKQQYINAKQLELSRQELELQ
ncbi:tetratricopeptide repeat protein [Marivirga salinae]|uniref:Tetratricopeptide repeat protein n=1 Tax=Marivirga salinarum TaxID=3059078 RepID=A0AA51NBN9_9BACT|nr:tetratricopeptide repeat protein [Marivirga sp. BDSF4-3]WMN12252.1 tetratricopeptide repeat protein [Marivirga sp. BDSF4-3]